MFSCLRVATAINSISDFDDQKTDTNNHNSKIISTTTVMEQRLENLFTCSICGMQFFFEHNMRNHVRIHQWIREVDTTFPADWRYDLNAR